MKKLLVLFCLLLMHEGHANMSSDIIMIPDNETLKLPLPLPYERKEVSLLGHANVSLQLPSVAPSFDTGLKFFAGGRDAKISEQIIKEIKCRLTFLVNVGLDYLTINRSASTLSGGESQRIRLATKIVSQLMGVLLVCINGIING